MCRSSTLVPKTTFPTLTDRKDWIVMVDEAHRTQYKNLAENMRIGLPCAQYIAFTGTPLLRNELTKDKFGSYVSEYNFAQSIEDGATIPLYYKKSVPRVEQVNPDLVGDAAAILEEKTCRRNNKRNWIASIPRCPMWCAEMTIWKK